MASCGPLSISTVLETLALSEQIEIRSLVFGIFCCPYQIQTIFKLYLYLQLSVLCIVARTVLLDYCESHPAHHHFLFKNYCSIIRLQWMLLLSSSNFSFQITVFEFLGYGGDLRDSTQLKTQLPSCKIKLPRKG